MKVTVAVDDERKCAKEDGAGEGGQWVDIYPTCLVCHKGEGGKCEAFPQRKVVDSESRSNLGSISGRHSPCLARQLALHKPVSTLDRMANMGGTTRSGIRQVVYPVSGLQEGVIPCHAFLFVFMVGCFM